MKKIIICLMFIILISSVIAIKPTEKPGRMTDEYDRARGCVDGEHYMPSSEKCVGFCGPAYEYIDGLCVYRCHSDQGFFWDWQTESCVETCKVQPHHEVCVDGKYNPGGAGTANTCAWWKKLLGGCKADLVKSEKSEEKEETPVEECDDSGRVIDGECIAKCDYYLYPKDQKGWMVYDYDLQKCMPEDDLLKVYDMEPDSNKVVEYYGERIGVIKHANGAVQYTVDEKTFYNDAEKAIVAKKNPGIMATFKGWKNFIFVGGKTKVVDQETKDIRLAEEISESMYDELKSKSKRFNEDPKYRDLAFESGDLAAGLALDSVLGPAGMGMGLPASSVQIAAEQGVPLSLRKDMTWYIKQREGEFSNSQDEIKETTRAFDPLTTGFFGSNDKMYDALELSYKRFCVVKQVRKESCRPKVVVK